MRRVTSFLVLMLFIGTTAFSQNAGDQLAKKLKMEQAMQQQQNADVAKDRTQVQSDALGDIVFSLDIDAITGDTQNLGADFDGTYLWVTGGGSGVDPNYLYKIDPIASTLVESYEQPATVTGWGIRDLVYDAASGLVYGGNETNFFSFDPVAETWTDLFTSTFGTIRGLAYDGTNFWCKSFGDPLYEFDIAGTVINTYTPTVAAATYGAAYDDNEGFLYLFSQDDATFYQFDLAGNHTGVTYDVSAIQAAAIAGGAFFDFGNLVPGIATLGFLVQGEPDVVGAMELYQTIVYPNDVGVTMINEPVSGAELTNAEPVMFTIKNFGSDPQSDIDWEISWSGPAKNPVTGTYVGPLAAGETVLIDAGTADLSVLGDYTFEACTQLIGDEFTDNDCKTKMVTNSAPMYCDASTGTEDEYIANVLCGDIDNTSLWQGGVADYTDQSTTIIAGDFETITVTNGNPWASDLVTCWVDWGADYVFDVGTDEEFILTSDGTGLTFTGAITVPGGTPGGDYRMRVRMSYSTAPTPCGPMSYGEVEDYTITVSEGADNDLAVTAILAPETGYELSNAEEVTIRIKNQGALEQSGFDVTYSFETDNPVTETVADVILPGGTLDYTFTATADLSAFGSYTFTACTELVGDEVPDNDCKEKVVENLAYGEISGSTKNGATNTHIGGVLVEAGGLSVISVGNPFGSFYTLNGLEAGTYTVTASKAGFFTSTYPGIVVLPGVTTALNITLEPDLPQALPFMEMWADTSFATNFWTFEPEQANWQMNATAGNPAPTARFSWTPSATDYEYSLVSRTFQGGAAKPIDVTLLDYDLFLSNYALTTVEGLAVELWDGATWLEVFNHDNQLGSIPWTSFSNDITDLVSDLESFKIRFRAYGANSFNINQWDLDNIHIYEATYVSFSGTITELSSGAPIEGATIMLDEMRAEVQTGVDGTYSISIPTGTYDVTLTADGYNTVVAEGVEILDDFVWDVAMTTPTLEVSPDAFVEEIEFGNAQDYTISVANNGNGPIDWTAQVQFITDARNLNTTVPAVTSNAYDEVNGEPVKPNMAGTDAIWDLQFALDVETTSGFVSHAGCETDGMYFYTCKWNGPEIHKFEMDGTYIETFTIPGVTGLRDLAYDGQYFYGGAASTTIYEMDFTNKTLVSSITSPGAARAIAYDDVNDAFWCNNWDSDMLLVGRNGTQLNSIAGVPSMYGAAFDNHTAGGPYLWFHCGTSTGAGAWVEQWDIASGTFTGVMHTITEVGEARSAGGLFLAEDIVAGTYTLGGVVQGTPNVLFGYELGSTTAPWLSLDMTSGTLTGSKESQDITMTLNTEFLNLGETYTANINFNGTPDVGMQTVSVELYVGGDIGYIVGTVTDPITRGPVGGVLITADETRGFSTTTGADGTYSLSVLGDMTYSVMAEKEGYISQMVEDVMVTTGENTIVDFALEFAAPVLLSAEASYFDVALEWEGNNVLEGKGLRVDESMLSAVAPNLEYLHGPTITVPASSSRAIGDTCTSPIMVDMLPYTDQNTTCGRGNSVDATCLGYYDGGEDIFYEFTLTEETLVRLTMETVTTWTGMLLTDVCPPDSNCIATATNVSAGGSQIDQLLAAGTYYIMIDTWPTPTCIPDFTLTIEEVVECVVECPAGAIDEGEACGEELNDGCNAEVPAYASITCGDVICGTAWADAGLRDTDWYELIIEEPKTITWTVDAEFPVNALIIDGNMGCDNLVVYAQAASDECGVPAVATATLIPGTYWLFVGNQTFEGSPCGFQNDYVAELTCEEAFITYYNLYRDDVEIAEVYGNTYLDEDVAGGNTYCYTVNQAYPGGETAMSNQLCPDVPYAPEIAADPASLSQSLYIDETAMQTLTINNLGLGDLDWDADISFGAKNSRVSIPAFTGNITHSEVSMGKAPYTNYKPSNGGNFDVLRGSTAYGFDMYPGLAYINFDTDTPGTYTVTVPTLNTVFAGDFNENNVYYAIDYDAATLNTVDLTTGTLTLVGTSLAFTDLAFDYTTNTMYAINYDDVALTNDLYTLNLTTGASTLIGSSAGGLIISMACDGNGDLYGFEIELDEIVSINKTTGVRTSIGAVGFDGNYAQSMAWDQASDIIYMSAYNLTANQGELRVVDKVTGATTLVAAFPGGAEVCALGFMGSVEPPSEWLAINPVSGMIPGEGNAVIDVTFDATVLEPGIYNATISIASNDPLMPVLDVPVELEVLAYTGTLNGYVMDATTRGPVQGVLITADEMRATALTNAEGFYEMELPVGLYMVTASKAGYVSQTVENIAIEDGGVTTQGFDLEFATPVLLYANGGVGEINLGWTGNPAVDGDNVRGGLSTSMQEEAQTMSMSKEEQEHGVTAKVPMSNSGRAIGDDCDNPKILDMTTFPVIDTDSTCGRGNNYEETCLGSYDGGEDIVYQFTIDEAKDLEITLTTTTTWTGILITQECPIASNCVTFITGSSANKVLATSLEAGTYYMMIDTYPSPDCIPEFTIEINEFVPEPGEFCATAFDYGNVNDEPALGAIETLGANWYSFTADQDYGSVDVSLCGSSFDTKLEVWYACDDATYAFLNDDSPECDAKAAQSFISTGPMAAGETWYAKVYGYSSNFGDYTLTISGNDACVLECPAGAIAEGEECPGDEYVDTFNGGCNSDVPVFTDVNCGDVVCGTASTFVFDGVNNRDTDWYELVITEPKSVTFNLTAEFPFIGGLIDQVEPGVAGCDNTTGSIAPFLSGEPCEEMSLTVELIPGTYYFFVSVGVFEGYPCGTSNDYIASWECADTFITYYDVIRDDVVIAQTYGNTYMDTDIEPDVQYCYKVNQYIEPELTTGESNVLCASMLCAEGCDFTLNFTDSYGDGWNGASVTLLLDGNVFGVYTLSAGSFGQEIVTLCDGLDLSLEWAGGSYPGECGFEMMDAAGNVLVSFLPGGAPVAGEFYTGVVACPVMTTQDVEMEMGWNAWSSYVAPMEMDMETLMAPVGDDMIITKFFNQLYYPAFDINTMDAFSNNHGYQTKMEAAATLPVMGYMAGMTVSLTEGWNLMPVLQDCSIPAADALGSIAGLVIAWEPTGNGIYYPAGSIYTLADLNPGMAYWVKVDADVDYTFPGCAKAGGSHSTALRSVNNTNWNDVNYTTVNHAVVFDANAITSLQEGDMLGAFTPNGWCAGLIEFNGNNLGFNLFGDDITTQMADGFVEGENLSFRLFRPATKEEFDIDVTYSFDAPNANGLFAINGVSVITDFKLSPTNIGENMLNGLNIYPNPSSGIFNIVWNNMDEDVNYVVLNAQGQEVYKGNLLNTQELDLSSEPKGVYFIKFINSGVIGIEKLVIK